MDGYNDNYHDPNRSQSRQSVFDQIYQLNSNVGSVDDLSASVTRLDLDRTPSAQNPAAAASNVPSTQTQSLPRAKRNSRHGRQRRASRSSRTGSPDRMSSMTDLHEKVPAAAKPSRPGLLVLNPPSARPAGAASPSTSRPSANDYSPVGRLPLRASDLSCARSEENTNYARPSWYDASSCRANTLKLIRGVERTDLQLQIMFDSGDFMQVG